MSDEVGSNRVALVHPARTAAVLAVVAALLLAGLLLLERSGPSPVQHLRSVSSGQPAAASATGSAGQSPTLAGTSASPSRLANADPSGITGRSQITAGDSTCSQFNAGTATTLSSILYTTKGTTISDVDQGAMWYWLSFSTSAGPQSFTITQATNYAPNPPANGFFVQGGGTSAFDSSCNSLATSTSGGTVGNPTVTVSFTAPAAGTYIIRVKLQAGRTIVGSSPASTTSGFSYNYTFATTGVSGSTQGLLLTHV
jgi:hypothetical protein